MGYVRNISWFFEKIIFYLLQDGCLNSGAMLATEPCAPSTEGPRELCTVRPRPTEIDVRGVFLGSATLEEKAAP